jgi:probable rRNA maturation factor
VKLAMLQDFAEGALRECLKLRSPKRGVLSALDEVSVILVSDRRMADLHRRFLQEQGPTDVITFQHGEILVSTETGRRQARQFGTTTDRELRLYIAHGLLHLHGYDDKDARSLAEMQRVQERLVTSASL